MTLTDLLTEARSGLAMVENAPAVFGNASRAKARERVRVIDRAVRIEAAAEALAESRVSTPPGCSCPECALIAVLQGAP